MKKNVNSDCAISDKPMPREDNSGVNDSTTILQVG